jgi:hypothetical protein
MRSLTRFSCAEAGDGRTAPRQSRITAKHSAMNEESLMWIFSESWALSTVNSLMPKGASLTSHSFLENIAPSFGAGKRLRRPHL